MLIQRLALSTFLFLVFGCCNPTRVVPDGITKCAIQPVDAPIVGAKSTAELRGWLHHIGGTSDFSEGGAAGVVQAVSIGAAAGGNSVSRSYVNVLFSAPVVIQGHEDFPVLIGTLTRLNITINNYDGKINLSNFSEVQAAIGGDRLTGTLSYSIEGVKGSAFLAITPPPQNAELSKDALEKVLKYLDSVKQVAMTGGPTTDELALVPVIYQVATPNGPESCKVARDVANLLSKEEGWEIQNTHSGLRAKKKIVSSAVGRTSLTAGPTASAQLQEGSYLISPNKKYILGYRRGGQVYICELKDDASCGQYIWTSDTAQYVHRWAGDQFSLSTLVLQADGNLGIYVGKKNGESVVLCGLASIVVATGTYTLDIDDNGHGRVIGTQGGTSKIVWSTQNSGSKFQCVG